MPAVMPESLTVNDLPVSERPRERLVRLGAEVLSEHELLACLLGRGIAGESVLISARRLLAAFGTVQGIAQASRDRHDGLRVALHHRRQNGFVAKKRLVGRIEQMARHHPREKLDTRA